MNFLNQKFKYVHVRLITFSFRINDTVKSLENFSTKTKSDNF